MKNKKIILLILVILLFSGCSVKYDLFINEDLTVNEKITANEDNITLKKNTGVDPKPAANSLYKLYKIDGVKYSFSTVVTEDETTSKASTSFKSLDEYKEYFKSDIVKEVNITKKNSYITLEYKQDVPLTDYSSTSLIYDSIQVSINVPFKVIEENADRATGNTYIWDITKDGKLKDIKITFDTDETVNSKRFDLGFFKINVKYSVLLVVGFVVIMLGIITVVYIRNKKNNQI